MARGSRDGGTTSTKSLDRLAAIATGSTSMKVVAAPADLIAIFNSVLPVDHRVEPRKMFGYPCCFTGGHMFMGLFQDHMMLRLSPEDRTELIAKGGGIFEPTPGKPMKEYVVVPPSVLENQN